MTRSSITSNNQLVVLAGGFGTRLKSILKEQPKPLADINGTPFLSIGLSLVNPNRRGV